MNTKKCLSVLLSCVLFTEPFLSSAHAAPNKDDGVKASSFAQGVRSKISKVGDYFNEHPKLKKGLKIAGIGAAGYAGIDVLFAAGMEIWFNCASRNLPPEFILEPTEDAIKKQEGLMWCWNASLQRALYKYGIEKTQKEIYKGITDKFFVSPLKSRRIVSAHPTFDSRCEISTCNFLERRIASNRVFNEEIRKYIEKVTNGEYTYQTVRIPNDRLLLPSLTDCVEVSKRFYNLCGALRRLVANKTQEKEEKVALLTTCPILVSGHMITIEGARDNKFFMGDPWTGTMVTLNNESFFVPGSFIYKFLNMSEKPSLPISFIIKKGQEITDDEWKKLIDEKLVQSSKPTRSE